MECRACCISANWLPRSLPSNSLSCLHQSPIEDLSAYGVAFISLRDNLDLSTPSGRLMLHIIGAMAEFERELIKERVSAGMHAARKRGSRIGRPRTYANADKIRALRAQDVPWRAIAAQLGIGTGTAVRALQNGGAA
jgi:DNA invertase Pin-like site-specific DNA recombinase